MKYTIGQLSRQIGIGREAIRYYENLGLIVSHRNDENGYRYYHNIDGLNLLHTRLLQSYEMPLSQIRHKMHAWSLLEQEEYLQTYEKKLRDEMQETVRRLARIQRMRGFIEDSRMRKNIFHEMDVGGLYKILILGDGIAYSERFAKLVRNWGEKFPITDIEWHIRMEDVCTCGDNPIPAFISLTVLPEYVKLHGYDVDPPAFFFPGGHTVRMILSTEDPFSLHYADIEPYFICMKERGYHIVSDLTGRYGGCEFVDGKPRYFFTLRAIVEKNK